MRPGRSHYRSLADAVADRFLGILWHQGFQLGLGSLVLQKCLPRVPKQTRKLRPGIGCAHVNNPDGLNPRPRRRNAEEARGLATLDLQMGGWRGS